MCRHCFIVNCFVTHLQHIMIYTDQMFYSFVFLVVDRGYVLLFVLLFSNPSLLVCYFLSLVILWTWKEYMSNFWSSNSAQYNVLKTLFIYGYLVTTFAANVLALKHVDFFIRCKIWRKKASKNICCFSVFIDFWLPNLIWLIALINFILYKLVMLFNNTKAAFPVL